MRLRRGPPLPALRSASPDVPLLMPLHIVEHALDNLHQRGARAFVERQLAARLCWLAMHARAGSSERAERLRTECATIERALESHDADDAAPADQNQQAASPSTV